MEDGIVRLNCASKKKLLGVLIWSGLVEMMCVSGGGITFVFARLCLVWLSFSLSALLVDGRWVSSLFSSLKLS